MEETGCEVICDAPTTPAVKGHAKVVKVTLNFPYTPLWETRILLADSEERIQAFETKCLRKLLCISDLEYKTNNWRAKQYQLPSWAYRIIFRQMS